MKAYYLSFLSIFATAFQITHAEPERKLPFPKDLYYQGEPLSDTCLEHLFFGSHMGSWDNMDIKECATYPKPEPHTVKYDVHSEDTFESSYCGEISPGLHVFWNYLWPAGAAGKFANIAFVKREGDQLIVPHTLYSGDRHSTMIEPGALEKSSLHFTRNIAYGTFKTIPGCEDIDLGSCYGEACYMGYSKWKATVLPNGKFQETFVSFIPANGTCKNPSDNNTTKIYPLLASEMCKMDVDEFNQDSLKKVVARVQSTLKQNSSQ